MKRRSISKRVLISALSAVMALGAAGTLWAENNVYGDDGSHIKIMTTVGESTSLPKTDFNGANILYYLLTLRYGYPVRGQPPIPAPLIFMSVSALKIC